MYDVHKVHKISKYFCVHTYVHIEEKLREANVKWAVNVSTCENPN